MEVVQIPEHPLDPRMIMINYTILYTSIYVWCIQLVPNIWRCLLLYIIISICLTRLIFDQYNNKWVIWTCRLYIDNYTDLVVSINWNLESDSQIGI